MLVTLALTACISMQSERMTSLVFASIVPDNLDLFVIEGDAVRRLTDLPGLEYHATCSRDGTAVVFTCQQGGNPDLWIVANNGGEARPFYATEHLEDAAEISPDGRSIVFVSDRDGTAGIWLATFDPANPRTLDHARLLTPEPGSDFRPTFSPDGKWVAYATTRDVKLGDDEPYWRLGSQIWIVAVDESEAARAVVVDEGWNGSPVFSADGMSLAYHHMQQQASPHAGAASSSIWSVDLASGLRTKWSAAGVLAAWPARAPGGGWLWNEASEAGWRLVRATLVDEAPMVEAVRAGADVVTVTATRYGGIVGHGAGAPTNGDSVVPGALAAVVPALHRDRVMLDDLSVDLVPLRAPFPELCADASKLATGAMALELVGMRTGKKRTLFRPQGLAPSLPSVWAPAWSPDASWLVVTAGEGFAEPKAAVDVWRVNADGSNAMNLTADSAANDAMPTVSPDGRWIAFRSGRSGSYDLYLMNADGSDVRRLTEDPAVDTMPMFAPDGRRIAFVSKRDGNHDIYLLSLDARGRRTGPVQRITDEPGFDVHPHWSPDGKWLVIATDRYGWSDEQGLDFMNIQPYGELAAIRLSDRLVVRLTHNAWEEAPGTWSAARVPEPSGLMTSR